MTEEDHPRRGKKGEKYDAILKEGRNSAGVVAGVCVRARACACACACEFVWGMCVCVCV